MTTRFEWDPAKEQTNLQKHGLSFQEASLVFLDPLAVTIPDDYVGEERRWQTRGRIKFSLLIVVIHLSWEEDYNRDVLEVVRIISARAADSKEKRTHEREPRQF